jgi:hypothetical protein
MENEKKCKKCMGFGWWPMGHLSPMGPMDAEDFGPVTIKCPWCRAGFIDKGERYEDLLESKKLEDEGISDDSQDDYVRENDEEYLE